MQELVTALAVWLGSDEPTFYDSLFSNIGLEYKQIQRSIIHSPAVDPHELAYLQERVISPLPSFYQCKARADLALLLYRQGRRSEARHTLRLIASNLPNNSIEMIALKVRAALIMAAAGDFQSAHKLAHDLYNATINFPIQHQLELEVLPFFDTLAKKSN
jgi:hypothetical protein